MAPSSQESEPPGNPARFSRDGLAVLGMMARPSRQFTEAEGAQFAAQGLLADRNGKLVKNPLRQVDQPPAHHPVHRRVGTGLNDPLQRRALLAI